MKKIWALIVVAGLLGGCGGDGGDSAEDAALPTSLMCEHDGTVWACNEANSCIPTEDVEYIEEIEGEKLVKTTTGSIIIIAECGSNVTFTVPANGTPVN